MFNCVILLNPNPLVTGELGNLTLTVAPSHGFKFGDCGIPWFQAF